MAAELGVEEEFHVLDPATGCTVARAPELLDRLAGEKFSAELKPTVVEIGTRPCRTLPELRVELARLRAALLEAADALGVGVVAAGSVPQVDPGSRGVTREQRYENIGEEYQVLARDQQICGCQIHVEVEDRELAVAAMAHVAPWLPVLLALSASSPFWQGTDTGYASSRTLMWQRWPTAGPPPGPLASAAEYDRLVADLVASGTISDPGMVYFDLRPSAHLPTLEVRVADSCPRLEDVLLLAGLSRALVERGCAAARAGRELPETRAELLRGATWRAARSGLEGDLVDLSGPGLLPAAQVVAQLVNHVRTELRTAGDDTLVEALVAAALRRGSSAARQRATARSGGPAAVVAGLLTETRAADGELR